MSSAPTPIQSPTSHPPRWDPTVFGLIGIACAVFTILFYYGILHRQFCNEIPIDLGQRRRLDEENYDDFSSLQFQSRALDSYVMHSLPITQFEKKTGEDQTDRLPQIDMECAVCLGEFEEGEWLKHLPNCSHVFHVSCIDTWFQSHSNCPLCRAQVYNLHLQQECYVSEFSLLENLSREDFHQERSAHHQIFLSHILHTSPIRHDL